MGEATQEIRINLTPKELEEIKNGGDMAKATEIFNNAYQRGDWTIY